MSDFLVDKQPKFELRSSGEPGAERFRFQLIAANGEPLCSSEPYNSKEAALHGIAALRRAASAAEVEDQAT